MLLLDYNGLAAFVAYSRMSRNCAHEAKIDLPPNSLRLHTGRIQFTVTWRTAGKVPGEESVKCV